MKKAKKILITIVVAILALCVIGYVGYRVALNIIGDKAMDMLLENQINNMLDSGEITLEELEEITADEAPEDEAPPEDVGEQTQPQDNTPSDAAQNEAPEKEPAPQKAPAPASRAETVKKATEKAESGMSRADKEAMAKLITSRLSASDISYLSGLLKDGLTGEEISAAARLAYSRFTDEEIKQVKSYWHKYKNSVKKAK